MSGFISLSASFPVVYENYVKKSRAALFEPSPESIFEAKSSLESKIVALDSRYNTNSIVATVYDIAPNLPGLDLLSFDQLWKIIESTPEGMDLPEKYRNSIYLDNLRYFYRVISRKHSGAVEASAAPLTSSSVDTSVAARAAPSQSMVAPPILTPTTFPPTLLPQLEQPLSPVRSIPVTKEIDYDQIYSYPTLARLWMVKTGNTNFPKGLTNLRQALQNYDQFHPESKEDLTLYLQPDDAYANMYKIDDLKKLLLEKHQVDNDTKPIYYESTLEGLREQLRIYDIDHIGSRGFQLGKTPIVKDDEIEKITNYNQLATLYEMALRELGRQMEYVPPTLGELRQAIRDVTRGLKPSSSTNFDDNLKWILDVNNSRLSPELVDVIVENFPDRFGYLDSLIDRLFFTDLEYARSNVIAMKRQEFNNIKPELVKIIKSGDKERAKTILNIMVKNKLDHLSKSTAGPSGF